MDFVEAEHRHLTLCMFQISLEAAAAADPDLDLLLLLSFRPSILARLSARSKLVNGSRVGQVGPVDSCGQVRDLVRP